MRTPKLLPIASFLVDQGNVNFGQFLGFQFDSGFKLTSLGDLIEVSLAGKTGDGEDVQVVRFQFNSPSPMNLGILKAGEVLNRAAVLIETVFDDPASFLRLGTSSFQDLVLGPGETDPTRQDQYDTDALTQTPVDDMLQLIISPGSSTQGSGLLLFKIKR